MLCSPFRIESASWASDVRVLKKNAGVEYQFMGKWEAGVAFNNFRGE